MSHVLVLAQHADGKLNPATSRTVNCAREISDDVTVAVFGNVADEVAESAACIMGVKKVLSAWRPENERPLAAVLAPQVKELVTDYSHILVGSTTFGKDLMARVAGLVGVPQVSDIMAVEDARTFKRPIYAGNVITTVRVPADIPVLATVRTASYADAGQADSTAPIEPVNLEIELPAHTRYLELESSSSNRPDLQSATRVISGGRGVGSKENFEIVFRLADKLGAAVGASRAAVDAGFVPNDMQVGQTGKIIAPELYMAFGISGAIQHVTGIKDAGTIVAVNKDPDAPIFEIADLGLVGDLFEIIPELEKALSQ